MSLLTTVLYCLLLSVSGYFFWSFCIQKKSKFRQCAAQIEGPIAFPIIGSAYVLFGGTHNILVNIAKIVDKYQPLCKLWLGNKFAILPTQPADIQTVLNKCLEKEEGYRFIRPVFGYGLFTRSVEDWKDHRKVIVSTFNQQVLNGFVETFNKYSWVLVDKFKSQVGDYVDMFPPMTQCTLDAICSTVMGTEMNAMKEESQFILWMSRVAELSIIRMFNLYFWPDWIWKLNKISKESQDLDDKIQNYVKKVIQNHRPNDGDHDKKIFLDHLLDLTSKDPSWNVDEVTHETRSVVMAGSDATALTLSYCLVMLAMFQDVQAKIVDELFDVFGDSSRDVTLADLPKLDYLERFIKETLRLFPVTSTIGREATCDITLGKYRIPKGTSIGIPIFYLHRSPKFWPEPLKFDPDRFLPEEVAKRHPCCYLPFSYGPRNCIGFKYAYMVMKVILANLLRVYKVTSTTYEKVTDLKVKMDVATKCDEGYPVKLELREG